MEYKSRQNTTKQQLIENRETEALKPPGSPSCPSRFCWEAATHDMSLDASQAKTCTHLGVDERDDTTLGDDNVTEELVQPEGEGGTRLEYGNSHRG